MYGLIRDRRVSILKWAAAALVLLALLAPPYAPPTQQAYAANPAVVQDTYPVLVSLSIPASSSGLATAAGTLGTNNLVGVVAYPGGNASLSTQTPINVTGLATLVVPCVGWVRLIATVVVSGVVPITVQDGTAPSSSVFASGTAQLSADTYVWYPGQQVSVPIQGTASIQASVSNVTVNPGRAFAVVYNSASRTLSGAGSVSFSGGPGGMWCRSFLPSVMQTGPGGNIVYRDDFSNPASGWPVGGDSNCKAEYKDGRYRVTVGGANRECVIPAFPVPPRSSGIFSVKMQRRSPDDYPMFSGMWFGQIGTDATKNHWGAMVRSDRSECEGETRGVLWLRAVVNGETKLFKPKCTDRVDLDKGDPNHLKIVRGGGKVKVYINDRLVEDADDNWLPGEGYFDLVVTSGSRTPIVVDFDDFVIEQ